MNIIDTHAHLDMLDYENNHRDVAEVVQKAKDRGVTKIIQVCVTPQHYFKVVEEYSKFPEIYFAVGLHPCYVQDYELNLEELEEIFQNPRVVALGEIGLDAYHTTEYMDLQYEVLEKQLALAKKLDKPVIIHTRGFVGMQTIDFLEKSGVKRVVVHCFTETQDVADRCIANGYYIGVGGIATFKNAEELRQILRTVPVEQILTETDCPYLAPVPFRGKPNQPAYTYDVVAQVCAVKGMTTEQFAEQTFKNADTLFRLSEVA